MHKFVLCCLASLTLGVAQAAADSFFSDSPSFFGELQGPSYTETFSNPVNSTAPSYDFSSDGFGYTVTTTDQNVFYGEGLIGADQPNIATIINFTSGNVLAVGGNFFDTDTSSNFVSREITLSLDDGTSVTFTPTSTSDFVGFTAAVPISSLTFTAPTDGTYSSFDNLTVGTTVPEPSPWALLGLGAAGAIAVARRGRSRYA